MCCRAPPFRFGVLEAEVRQSGARSKLRQKRRRSWSWRSSRPTVALCVARAVVSALRPSALARSSWPDAAQAIANRARYRPPSRRPTARGQSRSRSSYSATPLAGASSVQQRASQQRTRNPDSGVSAGSGRQGTLARGQLVRLGEQASSHVGISAACVSVRRTHCAQRACARAARSDGLGVSRSARSTIQPSPTWTFSSANPTADGQLRNAESAIAFDSSMSGHVRPILDAGELFRRL
jgi:hypothetical protein